MTVFGRDASDFDGAVNDFGLGFLTHKSTEGASVVHTQYGPRLNAARAAGVPVLGSYHVVRTGNLAAQLAYWVAYLDAQTPWWRTHPHWVMQIDAEKWSYDNVSASTVMQFAAMLANSGLPGWKVTYASRGQYGDSLRGIATPLWNADYRGSSGGSYPGDGWTSSGGSAAGWAPFSGQTPVILQYTSTPYDKDAYRGSLDQLLALTGGNDMTPEEHDRLVNIDAQVNALIRNAGPAHLTVGDQSNELAKALAALAAPRPMVLTQADRDAIVAALAGLVPTAEQIAKAVLDGEAARLQS